MLQLIWKWPSSPDERNRAHTQNFSPIGATTAEIRQIWRVFPRCTSDGTRWPGAEIAFLGYPQVWSTAGYDQNLGCISMRVLTDSRPQCYHRQDNVKYYHRKGSATITIAKTNLSKSSSATPSCATTARYFRCDRGQAAARLFLVLIPFPPPRVQLAGLNLHILNPDTFQQVWMPNPDGLILVIVARRMDTPENA